MPLIGLADAAMPESEPSREFAAAVDEMLFAPGAIDRGKAESLANQLRAWGGAGREVADTLAPSYPAVREAVPAAQGLADAGTLGAEAVQALASGVPLGAGRLSAGLARLGHDSEPNGSATLLPILRPVRLLLAAASRLADRARLSDSAWRSLVLSTAFPTEASAAAPGR
jgi:hypothetical protein